jgi:hypothetical protein
VWCNWSNTKLEATLRTLDVMNEMFVGKKRSSDSRIESGLGHAERWNMRTCRVEQSRLPSNADADVNVG